MITISDVARKAKVSIGTVSRYLNGTLKPKEETIKRIEDAIKETKYIPNKMAASMRTKTSNTIAIVIPASKNITFAEIGDAINEEIAKEGYSMVTYTTNDNLELEKMAASRILENRLAGAIFITEPKGDKDMSHIDLLEENGIKTYLINRFYEENMYSNISIDAYSGVKEVIGYLIEVNYKNIGIILGWENQYQSELYKKAYMDQLSESSLPVYDYMIRYSDFNEEEIKKIVEDFIHKGADAIFAISDRTALTAIEVLERNNIKMPEKMGIVGYGNTQFAKLVKMSSLDGKGEYIGQKAAQLLLNKIKGKEDSRFQLIPTNLVVRETTRKNKVSK